MRLLASLVLVACARPGHPVEPTPSPEPEPTPAAAVAAPLALESLPTVELARSTARPFTAGRVRAGNRLALHPDVQLRDALDSPPRIVVGTPAPTAADPRALRWDLFDPVANRVVARDIGEPQQVIGPNELGVVAGDRAAVVDPLTGAATVPSPVLAIADPVTATRLAAADGAHDVFLIATTGKRTFVGPWNDRAKQPRLVDEIPTPTGWVDRPLPDGIELGYVEHDVCAVVRMHRAAPPECITDYLAGDEVALTGGWSVSVEGNEADRQLVAHELDGTRTDTISLAGCTQAMIDASSLDTPGVVVTCNAKGNISYLAWRPGHASSLGTGVGSQQRDRHIRIIKLGDSSSGGNLGGDSWIDLAAGVILHGPEIASPWQAQDMLAFEGKRDQAHAVIVDPDAQTIRTIAATPCRGELSAFSTASPRFARVYCGTQDDPRYATLTLQWWKVIDLERARIYDMPGYPEVVFGDGTAVVSDRMQSAAESRTPAAHYTFVTLD